MYASVLLIQQNKIISANVANLDVKLKERENSTVSLGKCGAGYRSVLLIEAEFLLLL